MALFGPSGKQPSTQTKDFSRVATTSMQRSVFNRSHGYKTTFDAGYLIPIFVDEVLPGDTFDVSASGFGRLATPINPFMDNLHLETYYFFCPNRILWSNWEKFMGERFPDPSSSIDYLVPQIENYTVTTESLFDYMGVPTDVSLTFNNLYGRAYNLIYNEWFRDQNLQNSVTVDLDDGPDTATDYVLLKKGKQHDYFTSSLPWPLKNGDSVSLPLGTTAPVKGIGKTTQNWDLTGLSGVYETGNTSTTTFAKASYIGTSSAPSTQTAIEMDPNNSGYPGVFADLANATAATINQLREAFQIQALLEKDARGGTRYQELIYSHFGVSSPDGRLQRPEYLGGHKSSVLVNPIAQTSSTDATTPQGNMSGFGVSSFSGHQFTKSFTEHGVIIGLMCCYADLNYQQGLSRDWSRQSRYDFFWPALAHLGEQSVLNKEIYAQGTADDLATFGFQERFAEYRYKPSMITGKFRSNATGTLDSWHLAQDFSSLPSLNSTFIEQNPPIDRVIAVPSEPHMLLDMFFNVKSARTMPTYAVPATLSKF